MLDPQDEKRKKVEEKVEEEVGPASALRVVYYSSITVISICIRIRIRICCIIIIIALTVGISSSVSKVDDYSKSDCQWVLLRWPAGPTGAHRQVRVRMAFSVA